MNFKFNLFIIFFTLNSIHYEWVDLAITKTIKPPEPKPLSIEIAPYHVAVQYFDVKLNYWFYICGGIIINKLWVLTASNCAAFKELRVIVGSSFIRRRNNFRNASVFNVMVKYNNPKNIYPVDSPCKYHGIALLQLFKPFKFSKKINNILWRRKVEPDSPDLMLISYRLYPPNGLDEYSLELWSQQIRPEKSSCYDQCNAVMEDERCLGDSGDGLIGGYKESHLLVAILSREFPRINCSLGFYINIRCHVDWIESIVLHFSVNHR